MATQNPIEMEGTYPLPEAQLDRFLMKIIVGYPTRDELKTVVDRTIQKEEIKLNNILDREAILGLRAVCRQVLVAPHVMDLAVDLVMATQPESKNAHPRAVKYIRYGASPRATAPGVTAKIEHSSVALTGASTAEIQKAVDAIVAAGYTGTSDNSKVKVTAGTGADQKVTTLTVSGVHLCCGKCVTAAEKAIKSVEGVKTDTATKGVETFNVEGNFNAKALMAALAEAGFTGTAK